MMQKIRTVMMAGEVDKAVKQFRKNGIEVVSVGETFSSPYNHTPYLLRTVDVNVIQPRGYEYLHKLARDKVIVYIRPSSQEERECREETIILYSLVGAVVGLLVFIALWGFVVCYQ